MSVKSRVVKPMPSIVTTISRNVRRIITERGISGRKLAVLSGEKIMRVNNLLNGKSVPGIDLVENVADALGVSIEDLRRRPHGEKKSRKSA